jgi:ring-1,2-phenylacetyl-CoA epoxidase subunit PaaD
MVSEAQVWDWLGQIPDPEIPVLSLVDLGVIREVRFDGDTLTVAVTPTYSGCPATAIINLDIETALRARGVEKLRIERRLSPPWTTAWMSEDGRRKLREYDVAPPASDAPGMARLAGTPAACPRCGSTRARRVSAFGSTPCKANYVCEDCLEPFDYFKCI